MAFFLFLTYAYLRRGGRVTLMSVILRYPLASLSVFESKINRGKSTSDLGNKGTVSLAVTRKVTVTYNEICLLRFHDILQIRRPSYGRITYKKCYDNKIFNSLIEYCLLANIFSTDQCLQYTNNCIARSTEYRQCGRETSLYSCTNIRCGFQL